MSACPPFANDQKLWWGLQITYISQLLSWYRNPTDNWLSCYSSHKSLLQSIKPSTLGNACVQYNLSNSSDMNGRCDSEWVCHECHCTMSLSIHSEILRSQTLRIYWSIALATGYIIDFRLCTKHISGECDANCFLDGQLPYTQWGAAYPDTDKGISNPVESALLKSLSLSANQFAPACCKFLL